MLARTTRRPASLPPSTPGTAAPAGPATALLLASPTCRTARTGRLLPPQNLMPRIHILQPVYQQVQALVRGSARRPAGSSGGVVLPLSAVVVVPCLPAAAAAARQPAAVQVAVLIA